MNLLILYQYFVEYIFYDNLFKYLLFLMSILEDDLYFIKEKLSDCDFEDATILLTGAGGFLGTGGIDTDAAFDGVKSLLSAKAQELGADAIIGCDFEQRIANDALGKQVLEIFAYGTAVKII